MWLAIPQRSGCRDCHTHSLALKLRKQETPSAYSPATLSTQPRPERPTSSGSKSLGRQEPPALPGKPHDCVSQVGQTNQGLHRGLAGYLAALSRRLPKHQGISVWQGTYLPLHLQRAGGHLGQSKEERSGPGSGVRRSGVVSTRPPARPPIPGRPGTGSQICARGHCASSAAPAPAPTPLPRPVSFISQVCNSKKKYIT